MSTRVKICPKCSKANQAWREHCNACYTVLIEVPITWANILEENKIRVKEKAESEQLPAAESSGTSSTDEQVKTKGNPNLVLLICVLLLVVGVALWKQREEIRQSAATSTTTHIPILTLTTTPAPILTAVPTPDFYEVLQANGFVALRNADDFCERPCQEFDNDIVSVHARVYLTVPLYEYDGSFAIWFLPQAHLYDEQIALVKNTVSALFGPEFGEWFEKNVHEDISSPGRYGSLDGRLLNLWLPFEYGSNLQTMIRLDIGAPASTQ